MKIILLNEALGESRVEFVEGRRESLRCFVSCRILMQRRIERRVADEPARVAKPKLNSSLWIRERFFPCWHQEYTVDRNTFRLVEDEHSLAATVGAGDAVIRIGECCRLCCDGCSAHACSSFGCCVFSSL